jgi:hypothetical protein
MEEHIVATTVRVNNVPPTIHSVSVGHEEIREGGNVTLTGKWCDPGATEVTVDVDWGDGSTDTLASPLGAPDASCPNQNSGTYAFHHVYADDGDYAVTVCGDDGEDQACQSAVASVQNVAPTTAITELSDETGALVPTDVPGLLLGLSMDLAGVLHDAGTLDTHTAMVDWGDEETTSAAVSESPYGPPGSVAGMDGSISSSHTYAEPGDYVITLTVTDDELVESAPSLASIRVYDPSGAVERSIDDLLSLAATPSIAEAIDRLRGDDGGADDNGALDELAKGNANAALRKIAQALEYLEAAEAQDSALDLTSAKSFLTLVAKSVAVELVAEAEALAKPKQQAKIVQAKLLIARGDGLLASGDYVEAAQSYQEAVRKVQSIL